MDLGTVVRRLRTLETDQWSPSYGCRKWLVGTGGRKDKYLRLETFGWDTLGVRGEVTSSALAGKTSAIAQTVRACLMRWLGHSKPKEEIRVLRGHFGKVHFWIDSFVRIVSNWERNDDASLRTSIEVIEGAKIWINGIPRIADSRQAQSLTLGLELNLRIYCVGVIRDARDRRHRNFGSSWKLDGGAVGSSLGAVCQSRRWFVVRPTQREVDCAWREDICSIYFVASINGGGRLITSTHWDAMWQWC